MHMPRRAVDVLFHAHEEPVRVVVDLDLVPGERKVARDRGRLTRDQPLLARQRRKHGLSRLAPLRAPARSLLAPPHFRAVSGHGAVGALSLRRKPRLAEGPVDERSDERRGDDQQHPGDRRLRAAAPIEEDKHHRRDRHRHRGQQQDRRHPRPFLKDRAKQRKHLGG
jgi:hypothetical protein